MAERFSTCEDSVTTVPQLQLPTTNSDQQSTDVKYSGPLPKNAINSFAIKDPPIRHCKEPFTKQGRRRKKEKKITELLLKTFKAC